MGQQVLVYDENTECFRSLNTRNYNDDIIVGTIFFKKGAISVLKKYFTICGYVLINKYEKFPIDIRNDEIALLEGTYNCMPEKVKSELVKYNLIEKPEVIWSYFFFSMAIYV